MKQQKNSSIIFQENGTSISFMSPAIWDDFMVKIQESVDGCAHAYVMCDVIRQYCVTVDRYEIFRQNRPVRGDVARIITTLQANYSSNATS